MEQLDGRRIEYIDGIPVAYHQTDQFGGDIGPVGRNGVVVDEIYIQWPDGTGVSLQLRYPADWDVRNGGGSAYDLYLALQNVLHQVLLGADKDDLLDCAHHLAQEEDERD